MYEVVFTNIHTHMDYIQTVSADILVQVIRDMLKTGLFLSELKPV